MREPIWGEKTTTLWWYCWWKKSHSQPPGMVLKPCKGKGKNYQPQLVQDFFHQQYVHLNRRSHLNFFGKFNFLEICLSLPRRQLPQRLFPEWLFYSNTPCGLVYLLTMSLLNYPGFVGKCVTYIDYLGCTLPETNSSHLKIDAWKMKFPFGPGLFSRVFAVSFRECI